jgi:hypothetical protein
MPGVVKGVTGQQQVRRYRGRKKRPVVQLQSHQTGQAQEGQEAVTRDCQLGGPGGFERAQKDQSRKSNFLKAGHYQGRGPAGRVEGSITEESSYKKDQKSPMANQQDHPGTHFIDAKQAVAQRTGCQGKNQGTYSHEADYYHNNLKMLSDHFFGFSLGDHRH